MRGPAILTTMLQRVTTRNAGHPRDVRTHGVEAGAHAGRRSARRGRAAVREERRDRALVDIVRVLIAGDLLEKTVRDVVETLTHEVRLRSVVCTVGDVIIDWRDDALDDERAQPAAVSRAQAVARFLAGDSDVWPDSSLAGTPVRGHFVNLPLVTSTSTSPGDSGALPVATIVVGALQIESATTSGLAEGDLTFLAAVAQQLALGVQRLLRAEALRAKVAQQATAANGERDDAEQRFASLREMHDRYEALVDNLENTFVWEADAEAMALTYVSARVEEVLGIDRSAIDRSGRSLMHHLHPDDASLVIDALLGALSEGRDASVVHRCRAADGSYRWLHTGVHATRIERGRPRFQGVSVDVTEMKVAEQRALFIADVSRQLAEVTSYEEALAVTGAITTPLLGDVSLFDEIMDSGHLRRVAARIVPPNRAAIEHAVSLDAPHAVTARARALATISPMLLSEGPSSDERFRSAMRGANLVGVMIVPIVARDHVFGVLTFAASRSWGRGFSAQDFSLAQDIAQRAALALDRARLYETAQQAVRAREDLLAIVSHDLKNPLSVILLNLDMLTRMPAADDRRRSRRQLTGIARAAETMTALIQDLLGAAKVDALHLSVKTKAVAPATLVREAEETLGLLAAEKHLVLVCDVAKDLPLVLADRARVRQVFANLIGNAIKFTKQGTITVRACLEPTTESAPAVRFSVEDTGSGIPADDLPYVFDRFWQAKDTARLGSGLGLFIVKGIVEAQRGRAWVESVVGRGTTFSFTLPLALTPARE